MSFLLQEHIADPSNDAPVLNITPSSKIGLKELVDIISNLRLRHQGVISFARGSLKIGEVDIMKVVSTGRARNPSSAGWHMHGGFYSINLSRGSEIPTIFARPEDVSRAVVSAIRSNMKGIEILNQSIRPLPIDVLDLDEKVVPGQPRKLLEHMEGVISILSNSESSLEQISQALNTARSLLVDVGDNPNPSTRFYQQVLFNIVKESQARIPKEKTLEISPKKHDAYVVPPRRIHARSVREGRIYRPDNEHNVFIGLDRDPQRNFQLHPWIFGQ